MISRSGEIIYKACNLKRIIIFILMESVESTYGPLARHEKAYLFFPTCKLHCDSEKEQKTEFTKKGTRLFYFGQIEHDEYEKKKLA